MGERINDKDSEVDAENSENSKLKMIVMILLELKKVDQSLEITWGVGPTNQSANCEGADL